MLNSEILRNNLEVYNNSIFPHGFSKIIFYIYYLILALLFIIDIFRAKIEFKLPKTGGKKYFTLFLIVSAFVLYPLIEYIAGHSYPKIPLFGVAPCPTIIFSLALLIGSMPRVDKKIFILLILPAISYGFIVPITLGVWADSLLLISGIYGVIILIKNWKVIGK
jgi:hypothetical protein